MFLESAQPIPEGDLLSWLEPFLRSEVDRGVASRSRREQSRYLTRFCGWAASRSVAAPKQITSSHLTDFLSDSGFTEKKSSCKGMIWALHGFFSYLSLQGLVEQNPTKILHYPSLPERRSVPIYLQEDQLRALLKGNAAQAEFSEFLVLSLLATLGMRPGDICKLQPCNIHLSEAVVVFRSKGGYVQRLPVPESLVTLLSAHMSTLPDTAETLFANRLGRPITTNWIQRLTAKAGERIGLPFKLTPRIIRHTFATHAADRSGTVVTKRLLGHRYLRTTNVYTHLSPRRFRSLMNCHPYRGRTGHKVKESARVASGDG